MRCYTRQLKARLCHGYEEVIIIAACAGIRVLCVFISSLRNLRTVQHKRIIYIYGAFYEFKPSRGLPPFHCPNPGQGSKASGMASAGPRAYNGGLGVQEQSLWSGGQRGKAPLKLKTF